MRLVQLIDSEENDIALLYTDVSEWELEKIITFEMKDIPINDGYVEIIIEKIKNVNARIKCERMFVEEVVC